MNTLKKGEGNGGVGDGAVGVVGLTIMHPKFFHKGDCFIWLKADHGLEGKWDVIVEGEEAWLVKDAAWDKAMCEKYIGKKKEH